MDEIERRRKLLENSQQQVFPASDIPSDTDIDMAIRRGELEVSQALVAQTMRT
jgi:hypothetical protein